MTSTFEPDLPEAEGIAAEYVIGTLDHAERIAAEARIKSDARFAALVEAWQNRLADLNDDYAEAPAPNLLPKLEARLFPKAARSWLPALFGFGATTAAAIAVVAFLALSPGQPTLTAELSADASPLRYAAALTGDELTLTRLEGAAPEADKDYELWLIEGDKAPVSLGIIGDSYTITLAALEPGYVLAITLEPKGGGPDGKPTGPIVAAGSLKGA